MAERVKNAEVGFEVVTIGDKATIAMIEGMLPEFKNRLAAQNNKILEKHFVKPARMAKLVPRSSKVRYKDGRRRNLDAWYPWRGKFWPRMYRQHLPKKPYGIGHVPVVFNRKGAKYPKKYVTHRKHLGKSIRVARNRKKVKPWNITRVLWGDKQGGVPHAFWIIQRYGDYREEAIRMFSGEVVRQIGLLYQEVLKVNGQELARIGLKSGFRLLNPEAAQKRAARYVVKKESTSKVIKKAVKRAEDKGMARQEKGRHIK